MKLTEELVKARYTIIPFKVLRRILFVGCPWSLMTIQSSKDDVDTGHAWVILAAGFVMNFFVIGTVKSYGILYTEIDEYYAVGSGPVAFIGSIIIACALGLGPFANYLAVKTSFRKTTFVGGLLLGLGYTMSFFVNKMGLLFLAFVPAAGFGYGLAFVPCSTIISFYFEKRRALANGIAVAAGGIGTMAFSMLYKFMLEEYTLKPTMLLMGAILLNVCVAACCFRQPLTLRQQKKREQTEKLAKQKKNVRLLNEERQELNDPEADLTATRSCDLCPDFKFRLLKNPQFALYVVAFTLYLTGASANLILIPAHTKALGFSKSSAALAVTLFGAFEILSRILIGLVADKKWIRPQYIYVTCMFMGCSFAFISPLFHSFEYMCIYASVMGFFPASFWSLAPLMVIDAVGLDNFPAAYGIVMLGLAVGMAISHPTVGLIKDSTGDWTSAFYVTGSLILLSGLLVLGEPLLRKIKKWKENK